MRNATVLVLWMVTVLAGAGLIWYGVTATPTPDGWSRDREGALVIPAPQVGHNDHPSPVGPTVDASNVSRSGGTRVVVPSVGIDAPVEGVLARRGDGGWYPPAHGVARARQSAPVSARRGATMLAGHVWSVGDPGVFFNLHDVRLGAEVAVVADGQVERFRVTDVNVTPRTELPGWVWGDRSGPRRLILVTCGGRETTHAGHRSWDSNVIVVAAPIKA